MSDMRHVSGIADAGTWDRARAADRVVLDAADRVRRRIVLTTEKGQRLLLDFPEPMMLRDGDGLVLDDGSVVVVAGEEEALIEISAQGAARSRAARLAHRQPPHRCAVHRQEPSASGAIMCWRRW